MGSKMTPLLSKKDIADILRTSPNVAKSIMLEAHQTPIDLGRGPRRGFRWTREQLKAVLSGAGMESSRRASSAMDDGFFSGSYKEAMAKVRT
jgi:hypothetical protein